MSKQNKPVIIQVMDHDNGLFFLAVFLIAVITLTAIGAAAFASHTKHQDCEHAEH